MNKILVVGGQRAGKTKQAIEAAYEQGYKAGWEAALKAMIDEAGGISEGVRELVVTLRGDLDSSV